MAALTKERDTLAKEGQKKTFLMASNVKIFSGAIVCLEGGYAVPGKLDTDLVAVGVACETVDNTGGANGAKSVSVETSHGVREFLLANDTGDPIVQADVGTDCYVLDDQTVTGASSGASVAGKVMGLKDGQVWVRFSI